MRTNPTRRAELAVLGLTLALAGSLVSPAQAATSLAHDAEHVVVGPGVQPPAADGQGEWHTGPGRVTVRTLHPTWQHAWLPRGVELGDGFVRARLTPPRSGRATILLRATVDPKAPMGLSGYAVTLGKGDLQLQRYDAGRLRPLERQVLVPALARTPVIELQIWLVGPHLGVQLLDGDKLTPLASASLSDTTYTRGRLGLHLLARRQPAPVLSLLAVRPAGTAAEPRRQPTGASRFLELQASDLAQLAPGLRAACTVVDTPSAERVVVRVAPADAERLQRAGVPFSALDVDAPFRFLDAAWREHRDRPPEPTPTGFRLDRSYKDPAMVQALLRAYAERFPTLARLHELGRTASGRPILALKISDHPELQEAEPAVLINGGHHGDELLAVDFALDAVQGLLEGYGSDPGVRRLVDGLEVWVVPLVNPDGVQHFFAVSSWAGRKNARDTNDNGAADPEDGVDLNRNYPFRWQGLGERGSRSAPRDDWYRGPRPGSEAETQAIMRLADSEHFAASLSYHTWGTVILAAYTIDGVANPAPDPAWSLAEHVARAAPRQTSGRRFRVQRKIYAVDGVDQDWLRAAHGTAALLLEGALHNPLDPLLRVATVAGTRPTWRALLERTLQGPAIGGVVRDAGGTPVAAEVTVAELAPGNGEVWTSRCRDGRFDRLLPGPGTWTLRVQVPGRPPHEQTVTVAAGQRAEVAIELPFAVSAMRTGCAVPALCSDEAFCAARAGQCPLSGPPRWRRQGDTCTADVASRAP